MNLRLTGKKGYRDKDIAKIKHTESVGSINRKPVDWFDVEIRTGIKMLADIVQEYYGDAAMSAILDKKDNVMINKK